MDHDTLSAAFAALTEAETDARVESLNARATYRDARRLAERVTAARRSIGALLGVDDPTPPKRHRLEF